MEKCTKPEGYPFFHCKIAVYDEDQSITYKRNYTLDYTLSQVVYWFSTKYEGAPATMFVLTNGDEYMAAHSFKEFTAMVTPFNEYQYLASITQ